ncbi:MAG: hypothetical protein HKP44_07565 [Desulfofustis sp.]|nr:hypothetical protein [Desulfofustis sp.]
MTNDSESLTRLRVTVFLVSLVTISVELALMRELALRFWEHLAWLIISIALLGFGVSGTILLLLQRLSSLTLPMMRHLSLLGLSLSIPLSLGLGHAVDLDLVQMVWQPTQFLRIGLLQMVFTLPFIFSGMYIGLALQDDPARVPGHYGASFIGSGLGGILVLPTLFLIPPRPIMLGCAVLILVSSFVGVRGAARIAGGLGAGLLLAVMFWHLPHSTQIADDKDLPQLMAMPGSEIVASRSGPHGLVQIVKAPAFHGAPGLSLNNTKPMPDRLLVILDGHLAGTLYQNSGAKEFAFLDNTTMALAYHLLESPFRVLIGPEAGADQLGLALYHGAEQVTALANNSSLARFKKVDLASRIGDLYGRPEVSLITSTFRGYLYNTETAYSLIDLPITGEDFGGLRSATTNSLLTLDTLLKCFDQLDEDGVVTITTHAHVPPRESLRLVNLFADLLEDSNRDPRTHLAVIRSWATVTLVATKTEITPEQAARIRSFSEARRFDLVWLPDITPAEANRYHVLDDPQYYLGAMNLLGAQKSRFVSTYVYDLATPHDGKPFFHHFSQGLGFRDFSNQLGKRSRSYVEIGKLLLIGALVQTFFLALVLVVLPLLPAVGIPGGKFEQLLVIGFFSAIGCGFMLLEMGFLQRLEIYLGHPLYAAAAVLSGFLFFGGVGSILSARVEAPISRRHWLIGLAIALLAVVYLVFLDTVLGMAEGVHLTARLAIVMAVIGPLALLMGMMFPLGMKRLGFGQSRMIPWAWSVNGFTSVLATLLAPLLAMHWGFAAVGWTAAACYGLAALLSLGLPTR